MGEAASAMDRVSAVSSRFSHLAPPPIRNQRGGTINRRPLTSVSGPLGEFFSSGSEGLVGEQGQNFLLPDLLPNYSGRGGTDRGPEQVFL
jgi:hypothetical protein